MNISYSWLKDYVTFDLDPKQVSDALTSTGLETDGLEEVESIRGGLKGIVVGKVLTCVDHPDSDHLHITTVDLGQGEPVQIVCGAPNVAAGQSVIVATVGAVLYDGDKEFRIKKSKMRGAESLGMICAEDEIGVGASHDGIIVIPDDKAPAPGTPAAEYFNLTSDYVLEVDLTPNRIDAASHYGVARDLNAWLRRHGAAGSLRRPGVEAFHSDRADGAIPVEVLDEQGAPRYSGVTIRGVKVAESPDWLKRRLTDIGLRPINNIVDITNYILHGMGQPLHCFDLNRIEGGRIVVRTCPEGTKFTTLDGVERTLSEADLMICDAVKPMCIAGVFGGLDSGVTEETTDIFIESACFNPTRVRRTARRHGLSTDASFRYERGCDPNATIYNAKLAALMVKELAGGEICGDIFDFYPAPVAPYPVTLSHSYLTGIIGKDIPAAEVEAILDSLEIVIKSQAETPEGDTVWELEVPTYRVDVRRPCDVAEEILRIYGYNNVEYSTTVHSSLQFKTATDAADDLRRVISDQLTAQGFNEIMNNSLTSASNYEGLAQYPADHCVALLNPLSSDLGVMRQTLLFGGLDTLARNINRKADDLALYEFGNVYFRNPDAESTDAMPLAPYKEGARLAMWMCGNRHQGNWTRQAEEATFYDLKAAMVNVLTRMGLGREMVTLDPDTPEEGIFAAALAVKLRKGGRLLGHIGFVSKKLLHRADIERPVVYAELDWNALCQAAGKTKTEFTPLPKTLPVRRDLALLVDKSVTFAQVEEAVRQAGGKLLGEVELFDVYEGEKLPEGKKSYAISLTLQDPEKTLADKQIESTMQRIIGNLEKRLGASLR